MTVAKALESLKQIQNKLEQAKDPLTLWGTVADLAVLLDKMKKEPSYQKYDFVNLLNVTSGFIMGYVLRKRLIHSLRVIISEIEKSL